MRFIIQNKINTLCSTYKCTYATIVNLANWLTLLRTLLLGESAAEMPCEACNVQFTVFRRKRCCLDCKRFYCSNCLSPTSRESCVVGPLCERCSIFAKRPLLKVDLLQLKPKDLIFYLQSKHISTAGCVEKDELICLVLNHIQETDQSNLARGETNSSSTSKGFDSAHSFDALKQSCQHFFSTISEKVDSLSFDTKQNKQDPQSTRCTTSTSSSSSSPTIQSAHISEQPRSSIREIPTYSSSQIKDADDTVIQINCDPPKSGAYNIPNHGAPAQNPDSVNADQDCTHSPLVSLESKSSAAAQFPAQRNLLSLFTSPGEANRRLRSNDKTPNGSISGCECSDDEIITTFRARTGDTLESPQSGSSLENPLAGPSGSSTILTSMSTAAKKSSPSLKIESYGESSESSFEELGAIGGTSDDSKTGADNSARSSELWQFVDKDALMGHVGNEREEGQQQQQGEFVQNESESVTRAVLHSGQVQAQKPVSKVTRLKKVTRRRSESYINRRKRGFDDESPISEKEGLTPTSCHSRESRALFQVDEACNERDEAGSYAKEDNVSGYSRFHCSRCGKNRVNIKKHVERMRHYLEDSQMTESDIKRELEEFLAYLEKRTKSLDCSDSENTVAAEAASSAGGIRVTDSASLELADLPAHIYDENEGIYVYAAPEAYDMAVTDSRFINLQDFETLEELEKLCVKQLKEVLMLNRIDYKGCCEKQELLDRVVRLWKNLKSTPSIDKLQTDEVCKICMDAPIECVILECGHMATCTNCGKVLSECPICRQYIVRVVRIFKA